MDIRARSESFLGRIISTVASSLDLDEVLRAVVRLLTEGSAVHACFIYLLDEDEGALVLRAASDPFAAHIGRIRLERGEGLAWWAIEHREPAFIRDDLLSDPRVKYVPELEEERYQSLVSVPLVARGGEAIGAITAHTEAPREFTDDEVAFLVGAASLVAGAIENARLYGTLRGRVSELEALTRLAEAIAAADTLEELLPAASEGARALLGASACHLYLIEPGGEELALRHSAPTGAQAPARIGLAELGPQLAPRRRRGQLSVPLVAERELVGLVVAEGSRSVELARALAGQLAVGIRKVRLIDRLTERNLVSDFLNELAGGRVPAELDGRAARLGVDLSAAHVVVVAEPASDALEAAVRAALPGALADRREQQVRALVRVPRAGAAGLHTDLASALEDLPSVRAGLSSPSSVGRYADVFDEAAQALTGAAVLPGGARVVSFADLGPYRFLLRIAAEASTRDVTVERVARLAAYDAERQSHLLGTLEEFLRRHGSVQATSEALYVHPNTLRQRLRRIAELAEIDLRREDWLTLEIAVKIVRLRLARERD